MTLLHMKKDMGKKAQKNWLNGATKQFDESPIVEGVDEFSTTIIDTQKSISNIGASAAGNIVSYVDDFKCEMNCRWMTPCYRELHYSMCVTWLGGLFTVWGSIFSASFFNLIVAIIAL